MIQILLRSNSVLFSSDSEDVSLEYETTPTFDVVIAEGKKLKLKVHDYGHRPLCNPVWYFNGRPVSKSRCIPSYGELVCPSVKREDAGRYDLWGGDGSRHSQARLIFSANVQVTRAVERDLPEERIAKVQDEPPPFFERKNRVENDCFCSGVTERCRMALDLYRMRVRLHKKCQAMSGLFTELLILFTFYHVENIRSVKLDCSKAGR